MTREALPPFFYYFFWLVESSLSMTGAAYAIFRPEKYGLDLLPDGVERITKIVGGTTRGQMVIGGLGSCFFLLSMINLSLFPLFKKHLSHNPEVQEKMVKGLLIPLAIADLSHIIVTLLPLPMSLLETPSLWTTLINGNVWITVILFAVRTSYFLGIGRSKLSPTMAKVPLPSTTTESPIKPSPKPKPKAKSIVSEKQISPRTPSPEFEVIQAAAKDHTASPAPSTYSEATTATASGLTPRVTRTRRAR